jgi:hypothetical protein
MSPNAVEGGTAVHRSNFGDLTPYLTYGWKVYVERWLRRICSSHFTGWKVYVETWLRCICSSHFTGCKVYVLEVLCLDVLIVRQHVGYCTYISVGWRLGEMTVGNRDTHMS